MSVYRHTYINFVTHFKWKEIHFYDWYISISNLFFFICVLMYIYLLLIHSFCFHVFVCVKLFSIQSFHRIRIYNSQFIECYICEPLNVSRSRSKSIQNQIQIVSLYFGTNNARSNIHMYVLLNLNELFIEIVFFFRNENGRSDQVQIDCRSIYVLFSFFLLAPKQG